MFTKFIELKNIFIALLMLFGFGTVALAARVQGRLNTDIPENYKVVAVNKNGSASFAEVRADGRFAVRVKKGSTLHLVESDGRYHGPIILYRGTKAYSRLTGVSGRLGRFHLRTGFTEARYNAKRSEFYASRPRIPYDSETGPLGSDKFGFIEINNAQGANKNNLKPLAVKPGLDSDADGLPDLLDIDDDGDLVLDIVDALEHTSSEFEGETFSTLRLDLVDSLNVNAGAITDDLIDDLISDHLILRINLRNNGERTVSSVNVDCQNLSYCTNPGGTATIRMDEGPLAEDELWTDYDPDNDGLPNLQIVEDLVDATIGIRPHATRDQLQTGDMLLMTITNSDSTTAQVPALIPFVFVTGPALKEYSNGGAPTAVNYPVPDGDVGTSGNPIVLANGLVTLTFWKPQRKNIEGAESEGYYDMGGLNYGVSLAVGQGVYFCNADEYSNLSETLSARAEQNQGSGILKDSSLDTPAASENTLTYTIDMDTCLSRQGVDTSGAIVTLAIEAVSDQQDSTSQFVYFQLP